METLARSDAFFFITTICIVLVTLIVLILGAYFWTIITDLRYIVKKAKDSTDLIVEDIHEVRKALQDKGRTIGALLSGFFAFRAKKRRKSEDKD